MQGLHPKYRPDIDGLRGIAVLLVVGFHAFPTLLPGGFIGVDVFFVISGYLISSVILLGVDSRTFSYLDFYVRRIRRIFPALLLVLSFCLITGWFLLLPHDYAQLGKHIAGGAGFAANFLLLAESGYFDALNQTKPLLHLWSLGVEEQFYLIWPCCLVLICARHWNAVAITVIFVVVSFVLNVVGVTQDPSAAFYSPQTRFWEPLVGAYLALTSTARRSALAGSTSIVPAFPANQASIVGAVCLMVGLFVVNDHTAFPGYWAILPVASAALIIAGGPTGWFNQSVLSSRPLVWFGLISYPLYIWHWPILAVASSVRGELPPRNQRVLLVLLAIVLAWLTYQLFEKPLRTGKAGRLKAFSLLSSVAIAGLLGFNVYRVDGSPDRYSPVIGEIDRFESHYDHKSAWREGSCFLELSQDFSAFDACDSGVSSAKPIILIWGDSHAADLYPGYKAILDEKFRIVQRTASACAPLFGDAYNDKLAHCNEINSNVIRQIATLKPHQVILSARWSVHDVNLIPDVVARLHAAGVTNIELIGPAPRWKVSLPRQLIAYIRQTGEEKIPERMSFGLDVGFGAVEPVLLELVRNTGIRYESPLGIMCDLNGCLTRTGQGIDSLTTFDYDHFTATAAIFLVSHFATHDGS